MGNHRVRYPSSTKACFVTTSPFPLNAFLGPHLARLQSEGYELVVCVNASDLGVLPEVPVGVRLVDWKVRREIALFSDLARLIELYRFFRAERFDLVFSINPKAGLLAMLAAKASGVAVRIHCFTGQIWATLGGFRRRLLWSMDVITAACSSHVLADSDSQARFIVAAAVVDQRKISVLANGSIAGVDVARFCPSPQSRHQARLELGINEKACCLIYVGRLKRDKGLLDLRDAYVSLRSRFPDTVLLLVGPDDENISPQLLGVPGVVQVGYTRKVEAFMAAADILCLPSYREGFGLVLIEAAAVGLPVVASRIYGITDAVVDGQTGLLHHPGDIQDLTEKLSRLIGDPSLRSQMGLIGRQRALEKFSSSTLVQAMSELLTREIGGPCWT